MGESPQYCDFCDTPVSALDLANGRALVLLKKCFCEKCLEKAVRKRKPAEKKHDSTPSNVMSAPT